MKELIGFEHGAAAGALPLAAPKSDEQFCYACTEPQSLRLRHGLLTCTMLDLIRTYYIIIGIPSVIVVTYHLY